MMTMLPTQLRSPLPTSLVAARPVARAPRRLRVAAEESMTDAYARIRESRKRAADERVRDLCVPCVQAYTAEVVVRERCVAV
jgi:hypothetical protein